MKFNTTKFNDIYHKVTLWIFSLGLMIYITSFNSFHVSQTYNQLNLTQVSHFRIDLLENVGEREKFPLLLLEGKIVDTQQRYKCKISRGEYEKRTIGDTILVYENHDCTTILTNYTINNLKPFLTVFNYKLSIYVLGEALLFLVMLTLFIFTSKSIYRSFMSKLP